MQAINKNKKKQLWNRNHNNNSWGNVKMTVSFAAKTNLSHFVACAPMCCSRKFHSVVVDIGHR